MAKKPDIDQPGMDAAKQAALQMVSDYATLRENQELCEDAYFMDWEDRPADPYVKLTISPDPHNKVRGAVRLLTATSPTFNVPAEKNSPDIENASKCERAANAIWAASNSVQGIVVERDIAHTAILYGEMHLRVISTKDMLEAANKAVSENKEKDSRPILEANVKHLDDVRNRTPYLFEPLDAMTCYARRSRMGLEAHYQKIGCTVADVLAAWGGDAERVLAGQKSWAVIELNIFYDRSSVYVWVTSEKEPIFAGPHGLDFIPVAYYSPEGSSVYTKPERAIMPFLYPVMKSGVWQRQNLFLTVAATNAAAMMNAQFVHMQGNPDAEITMDHNVIGGIINVPPGSTLQPLAKEIINPGLIQQYQMYDELMDESTIFNQTLGEPMGGNTTFSATALLHQAGRLPLTPIQEGMASLLADAMGIAFRWLKIDGKSSVYSKTGEGLDIDPAQIPDALNFDVTVDVDLPQDKMQQANVGTAIAGSSLASREWVRNNILNIGQSDMEQSKIWKEQMADMAAQAVFPQVMQMMMQKMGLGQPPQPGQPGQEQPQPQGPPPQQPSPEQMAQMQQQAMQQAMAQQQQGQMPAGQQQEQPPMPPEQPIPSGMMPGGQGA